MNNGWTSFIILLLGDPHLVKGRERSKNRSSDPYGVFPLRRSNDLDLHRRRGEGGNLLLHTVGDSGVHGGATRENGVGVKVSSDVDVALVDGVVGCFVYAHLVRGIRFFDHLDCDIDLASE